ncbi:sulfatase-like hydrolase/transferase [Microbacterium sp. SSW1-59]|uniref:sulfatase-like hydrolase/transferase n=1 Tax=Microbacterium xanthum TaxID=3079794 RepID=UPI002AD39D7D|nr:sulfatase-like hydrolase/transferase [Microbacterium sp. SSW1-59]MDZ8200244.1 sulfatase-like hydrolase/transferase [Microbacterium sp. SSW1-59]
MKAIMVMFDSLNRRMLPPYGALGMHAPNFERLARRAVTFDTSYGGSMPCMPARREMHTARHNFLHRSWGPLEPFDDSAIAMLGGAGVHTHLATDHQHYWEDGGATYHTRYSTFELFRGQEGDPWKGQIADPDIPASHGMAAQMKQKLWRQDWVNRAHLSDEADHPQTRTFEAGLEFLQTNAGEDGWFLQIETFDPHEPFFSYEQYKRLYPHDYDGPHFDWPDYAKVTEDDATVEHARAEYAALLSMCDASLGRVLDAMDAHGLWEDTLLIVNTDHGFMLGEHGWWGKNVQPWYDETIHTPLFVWDPRRPETAGERREQLARTIDVGPTLLDWFGLQPTERMQGQSLLPVIEEDAQAPAEHALFGVFGGHACITDGRYVYMRASVTPQNGPLFEHTLMPTHMNGFFSAQEMVGVELVDPLPFTKGMKVLRTPAAGFITPFMFGTQLFDLATDPDQASPLDDADLELRMATALRDELRNHDAPASQFERLGLPASGPLDESHLLVAAQWPQLQNSLAPAATSADFGEGGEVLDVPLRELLTRPAAVEVFRGLAPMLTGGPMAGYLGGLSLIQIASVAVGLLPRPLLAALASHLTAATAGEPILS